MIEEIHLFGAYFPAALLWAAIAGLSTRPLLTLLKRMLPLDRIFHNGLLELTSFLLAWVGITLAADHCRAYLGGVL
jgi:hypothetical protein